MAASWWSTTSRTTRRRWRRLWRTCGCASRVAGCSPVRARSLTAGRAFLLAGYVRAFALADRAFFAPIFHRDRVAPRIGLIRGARRGSAAPGHLACWHGPRGGFRPGVDEAKAGDSALTMRPAPSVDCPAVSAPRSAPADRPQEARDSPGPDDSRIRVRCPPNCRAALPLLASQSAFAPNKQSRRSGPCFPCEAAHPDHLPADAGPGEQGEPPGGAPGLRLHPPPRPQFGPARTLQQLSRKTQRPATRVVVRRRRSDVAARGGRGAASRTRGWPLPAGRRGLRVARRAPRQASRRAEIRRHRDRSRSRQARGGCGLPASADR